MWINEKIQKIVTKQKEFLNGLYKWLKKQSTWIMLSGKEKKTKSHEICKNILKYRFGLDRKMKKKTTKNF